MIAGHAPTVRSLENYLPQVTLLLGPPSVGKWTLANYLADHHLVAAADRSTWPNGLSTEAVRRIIAFVSTAPFGPFKLVIARLDNSSVMSMNALLKTLEEPPPTAKFLLTASRTPLPTIMSRASIYRLGLLSVDDLTQVLNEQGLKPEAADRAAALGRGQVRPALRAEATDTARGTVVTVMRAVAIGDYELFDRTMKTWDTTCSQLLGVWFTETITGQWSVFTEADTFGLHSDQQKVRRMLVGVSRFAETHSRLGVRVALEQFLTT